MNYEYDDFSVSDKNKVYSFPTFEVIPFFENSVKSI